MKYQRQNRKAVRYVAGTALALALVTGGVSQGPLPLVGATEAVAAESNRKLDNKVAKAESRVEERFEDANVRAQLGHAYLQAGRFESAATTFEDARALGDDTVRTALSLALAYIGSGKDPEAILILEQARDSIPDSDLGLALALAGETGRGIAILSDALRSGDNTAKIRQNLAYAYAMDGRWREARLMAAQDVPADQLNARMSEWAQQARPEDSRLRVASLLSAPMRADSGQPQHLALAPVQVPEAVAVAETSDVELAAATSDEVAPIENGESFWTNQSAKTAAPVKTVASNDFSNAFEAEQPAERVVSRPVVQPVRETAKPVEAAPVVKTPARRQVSTSAPAVKASGNGTHLVQLGSFSSPESAERAWEIYRKRYPELQEFQKTITPAEVRGKKYWRVAAAGYDRGSANSMCSNVKSGGRGCIAYSASKPLPGALPSSVSNGRMLAAK